MIRVEVVLPFDNQESAQYVEREADAVAAALALVGPRWEQVTLTDGSADNFDVRHFVYQGGAQGVRDSGWRSWRGGAFVGGDVREAVAKV